MQEIPVFSALTRGSRKLIQVGVALVDDSDHPALARFTWLAKRSRQGRTWYACRSVMVRGRRVEVFMHREILGLGPLSTDAREVDHINGRGNHNTRDNLRIVSHGRNMMNLRVRADSQTGMKGVTPHRRSGKFECNISCNRQRCYLGLFGCPHEAAVAYNAAARLLFGPHACLNVLADDKLPRPECRAELEAQVERTLRQYRFFHARTESPTATLTATR